MVCPEYRTSLPRHGAAGRIILRHTRSRSLYFYLRTQVEDGKIKTQVFATDSPYDRQKTSIGSVT